MAIAIITGIPGAGKTYYMVWAIIKEWCKLIGGIYEIKKGITLITNIDGLNLEHESLTELVDDAGGVKNFFTDKIQKEVQQKYASKENERVVYVIDEAQDYFRRKFYDEKVFKFFEYHRHYGFDIFLLTQNRSLLCRDISNLAEYEKRAAPRSLTFVGFRYLTIIGGDILKKENIKKDKRIFQTYKSFSQKELTRQGNPYLKTIIFGLFFVLLMAFIGYKTVFNKYAHASSSEKNKPRKIEQIANNAPGIKSSNPIQSTTPEKLVSIKHPVKLNYILISDGNGGNRVRVIHPINDDLVPIEVLGIEYRVIDEKNYIRIYALLDSNQFNEYQSKRASKGGARARSDVRPSGSTGQPNHIFLPTN